MSTIVRPLGISEKTSILAASATTPFMRATAFASQFNVSDAIPEKQIEQASLVVSAARALVGGFYSYGNFCNVTSLNYTIGSHGNGTVLGEFTRYLGHVANVSIFIGQSPIGNSVLVVQRSSQISSSPTQQSSGSVPLATAVGGAAAGLVALGLLVLLLAFLPARRRKRKTKRALTHVSPKDALGLPDGSFLHSLRRSSVNMKSNNTSCVTSAPQSAKKSRLHNFIDIRESTRAPPPGFFPDCNTGYAAVPFGTAWGRYARGINAINPASAIKMRSLMRDTLGPTMVIRPSDSSIVSGRIDLLAPQKKTVTVAMRTVDDQQNAVAILTSPGCVEQLSSGGLPAAAGGSALCSPQELAMQRQNFMDKTPMVFTQQRVRVARR
jgi:hypothetical protein